MSQEKQQYTEEELQEMLLSSGTPADAVDPVEDELQGEQMVYGYTGGDQEGGPFDNPDNLQYGPFSIYDERSPDYRQFWTPGNYLGSYMDAGNASPFWADLGAGPETRRWHEPAPGVSPRTTWEAVKDVTTLGHPELVEGLSQSEKTFDPFGTESLAESYMEGMEAPWVPPENYEDEPTTLLKNPVTGLLHGMGWDALWKMGKNLTLATGALVTDAGGMADHLVNAQIGEMNRALQLEFEGKTSDAYRTMMFSLVPVVAPLLNSITDRALALTTAREAGELMGEVGILTALLRPSVKPLREARVRERMIDPTHPKNPYRSGIERLDVKDQLQQIVRDAAAQGEPGSDIVAVMQNHAFQQIQEFLNTSILSGWTSRAAVRTFQQKINARWRTIQENATGVQGGAVNATQLGDDLVNAAMDVLQEEGFLAQSVRSQPTVTEALAANNAAVRETLREPGAVPSRAAVGETITDSAARVLTKEIDDLSARLGAKNTMPETVEQIFTDVQNTVNRTKAEATAQYEILEGAAALSPDEQVLTRVKQNQRNVSSEVGARLEIGGDVVTTEKVVRNPVNLKGIKDRLRARYEQILQDTGRVHTQPQTQGEAVSPAGGRPGGIGSAEELGYESVGASTTGRGAGTGLVPPTPAQQNALRTLGMFFKADDTVGLYEAANYWRMLREDIFGEYNIRQLFPGVEGSKVEVLKLERLLYEELKAAAKRGGPEIEAALLDSTRLWGEYVVNKQFANQLTTEPFQFAARVTNPKHYAEIQELINIGGPTVKQQIAQVFYKEIQRGGKWKQWVETPDEFKALVFEDSQIQQLNNAASEQMWLREVAGKDPQAVMNRIFSTTRDDPGYVLALAEQAPAEVQQAGSWLHRNIRERIDAARVGENPTAIVTEANRWRMLPEETRIALSGKDLAIKTGWDKYYAQLVEFGEGPQAARKIMDRVFGSDAEAAAATLDRLPDDLIPVVGNQMVDEVVNRIVTGPKTLESTAADLQTVQGYIDGFRRLSPRNQQRLVETVTTGEGATAGRTASDVLRFMDRAEQLLSPSTRQSLLRVREGVTSLNPDGIRSINALLDIADDIAPRTVSRLSRSSVTEELAPTLQDRIAQAVLNDVFRHLTPAYRVESVQGRVSTTEAAAWRKKPQLADEWMDPRLMELKTRLFPDPVSRRAVDEIIIRTQKALYNPEVSSGAYKYIHIIEAGIAATAAGTATIGQVWGVSEAAVSSAYGILTVEALRVPFTYIINSSRFGSNVVRTARWLESVGPAVTRPAVADVVSAEWIATLEEIGAEFSRLPLETQKRYLEGEATGPTASDPTSYSEEDLQKGLRERMSPTALQQPVPQGGL